MIIIIIIINIIWISLFQVPVMHFREMIQQVLLNKKYQNYVKYQIYGIYPFAVKKEMPKFLKKPDNVECLEYEDIRFDTLVTGKPKPEVTWYCGDNQVMPSDKVIYEDLGDNRYGLVLKSVLKDQSSMYTVKATNEAGAMSASARLKVTRECLVTHINQELDSLILSAMG